MHPPLPLTRLTHRHQHHSSPVTDLFSNLDLKTIKCLWIWSIHLCFSTRISLVNFYKCVMLRFEFKVLWHYQNYFIENFILFKEKIIYIYTFDNICYTLGKQWTHDIMFITRGQSVSKWFDIWRGGTFENSTEAWCHRSDIVWDVYMFRGVASKAWDWPRRYATERKA